VARDRRDLTNLGVCKGESQNSGYSKSRGHEVRRRRIESLDPDRRRTVGSTRGIVYRDLVRKDPRNLGAGITRLRESDIPTAGG
jgi:hypothetical protein